MIEIYIYDGKLKLRERLPFKLLLHFDSALVTQGLRGFTPILKAILLRVKCYQTAWHAI